MNGGVSAVMSAAGMTDESNHDATGITAIPVHLNDGVTAVMIAVGVDARVDAGVINELHYPEPV